MVYCRKENRKRKRPHLCATTHMGANHNKQQNYVVDRVSDRATFGSQAHAPPPGKVKAPLLVLTDAIPGPFPFIYYWH